MTKSALFMIVALFMFGMGIAAFVVAVPAEARRFLSLGLTIAGAVQLVMSRWMARRVTRAAAAKLYPGGLIWEELGERRVRMLIAGISALMLFAACFAFVSGKHV
jgi:hypothetical protein